MSTLIGYFMAKISILMNCYNGEEYLKEALNSIFAQTYTDWEIIFIDNFSTDSSVKIAKEFGAKVKIFRPPCFCPLGKARNFGLTKCSADYLAFLDTDDIWEEDKLKIQFDLLQTNENIAFTYSGYSCIDHLGDMISNRRVATDSDFIRLIKRYDVNMQTVMINTLVVHQDKLVFDESLSYNPDFKLFIKLAHDYPVLAHDGELARYRISPNSLSKKLLSIQVKENLKVLNYLLQIASMPEKYISVLKKQKEYYFWKSVLSKSLNSERNVNYKCFFYLGHFSKKYWIMLLIYLVPFSSLRSKVFKHLYINNWIS